MAYNWRGNLVTRFGDPGVSEDVGIDRLNRIE
jgi:hypothetical protein